MYVPTWESLQGFAGVLGISLTHAADGQVQIYSPKTGGRASFGDDDEGRVQALRWMNKDQKVLRLLKGLRLYGVVCK